MPCVGLQVRSQAIFGSMHNASPKFSQREGNRIILIITLIARKSFYYFYGSLVLSTYRRRLIALCGNIWISGVRQLHEDGFLKHTSKH